MLEYAEKLSKQQPTMTKNVTKSRFTVIYASKSKFGVCVCNYLILMHVLSVAKADTEP